MRSSSDFYCEINWCIYWTTPPKTTTEFFLICLTVGWLICIYSGLRYLSWIPAGISFHWETLFFLGAFESERWRLAMTQQTGYCRGVRGGRAQAHVADTTDRGHFATSDWKSFGNVPCLCEYHHLSTGCLIRISLRWQSVASVLQTVSLGVTTGKGRHFFMWMPDTVHSCKFYLVIWRLWFVSIFHLCEWKRHGVVSCPYPITLVKTSQSEKLPLSNLTLC